MNRRSREGRQPLIGPRPVVLLEGGSRAPVGQDDLSMAKALRVGGSRYSGHGVQVAGTTVSGPSESIYTPANP